MAFTSFPAPPRSDAPAETYAAIRLGLEKSAYTASAVSEYLKLDTIADFFEGHAGFEVDPLIDSPLTALAQVFLLGRAADSQLLTVHLGEEFVRACLEIGLLLRSDASADALVCSAALYPFWDQWVASDRVVALPGLEDENQTDVVYPAATRSAQMFLGLLPRRECGRFLEVCGGCGPAALLAGEFARETTTSDLEPRSASFAAFNGRLLNLDNFSSITGSFFEGTEGPYDVIAAHPPYMPSLGGGNTYYGGGRDGTEVLRGLLAQLPGKLSPGGLFYAVAMIPEGEQATLEQNVRRWIGDEAKGFDVFSFPQSVNSIHQLALSVAVKNGGGIPVLNRFEKDLAALGHQEFILGALVVRRHVGAEDPVNVRRKLSSRSGWRELMWCIDLTCALKQDGIGEQLMADAVRIRPEFQLLATHKPSPEGLPPVKFQAITHYPFSMESEIQGWMSYLLARADGSKSGKELMDSLVQDQLLHPETPAESFAKLLGTFVAGGFLESSICPLPEAAG